MQKIFCDSYATRCLYDWSEWHMQNFRTFLVRGSSLNAREEKAHSSTCHVFNVISPFLVMAPCRDWWRFDLKNISVWNEPPIIIKISLRCLARNIWDFSNICEAGCFFGWIATLTSPCPLDFGLFTLYYIVLGISTSASGLRAFSAAAHFIYITTSPRHP